MRQLAAWRKSQIGLGRHAIDASRWKEPLHCTAHYHGTRENESYEKHASSQLGDQFDVKIKSVWLRMEGLGAEMELSDEQSVM